MISLPGLWCLQTATAHADLRSPDWWDPDSVGTAPDWHYRVLVSIPAGSYPDSTVRLDVDFEALLSLMGCGGAFDNQSPRVVSDSGVLVDTQQYTDTVYGGVTDAADNGRGEIRFILEDAGPVTYYIYFDILENGVKSDWPDAATINGNFEFSSDGQQDAPGWNGHSWPWFDAYVIANEYNRVVGTEGGSPAYVLTDETAHSGEYCYLIGARNRHESQNRNPSTRLEREITVPAGNPGVLQLRYRIKGWDSSDNGGDQWDFIRIQLRVGHTVMEDVVGPEAGNYTSLPFSPNLGTDAAGLNQSGYGRYNGWDTDIHGIHHSGMTLDPGTEPWFTAGVDLSGYAGQTITLRIETRNSTYYKTWFHVDDVEWSVVEGELGSPQPFGVDITNPDSTTVYSQGDTLIIQAQVDAGAVVVSADVYSPGSVLAVADISLYNDGTHGDAVAGDAVWTNDGSVSADGTYVFLPTDTGGTDWQVVVTAQDAGISVTDTQSFTLSAPPNIMLLKSAQTVSDPFNGDVNPKAIPGALVAYTIVASNQGGSGIDADTVVVTDAIPVDTAFYVGDLGQPSGPVAFVDGTVPSGLTYEPADDLRFSNDNGSTFNLDVGDLSADADGCDPSITHFRVNPKGAFAEALNGNVPQFTLQFRVRVQ